VRGREHEIEDDQPSGALSKAFESLFLRARLDDAVALGAEELAVHLAKSGVVIDEEHGLA
jgi:hypothetical protein